MKKLIFANNKKNEYVVTDVNLKEGTFKGFYNDFNGSKHLIVDKISNYEFYKSSTKVDEHFNLEEYLKD